MKSSFLFFIIYFFIFPAINAQKNLFSCTNPLPLNQETITKIFAAIQDSFIKSKSYFMQPRFCMEGQSDSALLDDNEYYMHNGFGVSIYFPMLTTASKKDAIKKEKELSKSIEHLQPLGWYKYEMKGVKGKDIALFSGFTDKPCTKKFLSDCEQDRQFGAFLNYDFNAKNLYVAGIIFYSKLDRFLPVINFKSEFIPCEKLFLILDKLKDSTIRGTPHKYGGWTSNIPIGGSANSRCVWDDVGEGKKRYVQGHYWYEYKEVNADQLAKDHYYLLKKNLKDCLQVGWTEKVSEVPGETWYYFIHNQVEHMTISVNLYAYNDVSLYFEWVWDKK